ncbi:MAG: GGDEF domain-containing protein [Dehalococcoidia bacterium]|nr:MAG: GGDEF domain-containing protein [Dehalococcoidia bacterium]
MPEPAAEEVITSRGRPADDVRRPFLWMPLVLRLLAVAWAGAIVVALLDEFGLSAHLPFIMAMGMTGLLVGSSFVLTRDDQLSTEEARRRRDEADEDGAKDLLTDLPTFNHFARRLADEFNRSRRVGRRVSVVLIDVNNLSAVNKEYGVRAGDEVLRHVALAIENTKRFSDVVARLGDDEFGVLLMNTGEEGVTAFIERLEDRLARDSAVAEVGGRSISLWAGVCSGSAVSDPGMMRAEAVLEQAMASLTAAKQDRERRRRMWLSA